MQMLKKIILIISLCSFFLTMMSFNNVSASTHNYVILDSGKCGENLYWELNNVGELRIYGYGKMCDYVKYTTPPPWYKYRREPYISDDGLMILNPDGSEYLSTKDYYNDNPNNWYINKILIENGVTYIGDWAFYRVCVEEISIPEGVEETGAFCFRYSPTLKVINLPNSLKILDDFAISRNQVLTTINFGNNLEKIGTAGLNNNKKLESVTLPDSVYSINEQLSPTFIGAEINYSNVGLMENCVSLKNVSLGSVDSIPQRTFLGTDIAEIVIPNTVKYIGEYAFYNCKSLKKVVFESSSKCSLVESFAFGGCTSLISITGGTAIEKIKTNAFNGDSYLSEFEFSSSNMEFGEALFYKSGIEYASIGPNVTVIPKCMFQFSAIKELYISKSVKEIQYAAINSCKSLTDIYYSGTEAEWEAINIAGGNNILKNVKVHYNYVPKFTGIKDDYFYKDDVMQKSYQLVEFEGDFYFINDYNKIAKKQSIYLSQRFIDGFTYADGTPLKEGYYEFDEDGKIIIRNGVVGDYFYKNNVRQNVYQLVEFEGDFYFINDSHKIAKNITLYLSDRFVNGFTYEDGTPLQPGYYTFDENGKLIILNGPVGDYFYENNVRLKAYQLVEFEGDIYFVYDSHKLAKNQRLYLSQRFVEGTDLAVGYYEFDENGKMIIK